RRDQDGRLGHRPRARGRRRRWVGARGGNTGDGGQDVGEPHRPVPGPPPRPRLTMSWRRPRFINPDDAGTGGEAHDPGMVVMMVLLLAPVVLFLVAVAAAEPLREDVVPFRQDDPSSIADESAWDAYGWRSLGA